MALRHRRSWLVEVLALGVMSGALACGGDEPARDQTIFWMALSPTLGGQCSSIDTFDVPNDGTARNITSTNGSGARFVDGEGDGYVECRVEEASTAGQFNLSLDLSAGDFGTLTVTGVATGAEAMLELSFTTTTSISLGQNGCTASVEEALPGAIWLKNLVCPQLVDTSSPNISCTGNGGLIAENCSR